MTGGGKDDWGGMHEEGKRRRGSRVGKEGGGGGRSGGRGGKGRGRVRKVGWGGEGKGEGEGGRRRGGQRNGDCEMEELGRFP